MLISNNIIYVVILNLILINKNENFSYIIIVRDFNFKMDGNINHITIQC